MSTSKTVSSKKRKGSDMMEKPSKERKARKRSDLPKLVTKNTKTSRHIRKYRKDDSQSKNG